MTPELIQILTSFTGSVGFSLLFGLRKKQLPVAATGAALTWCVYLIVDYFGGGLFLANMVAAIFAEMYTEVFVRVLKIPKTVLTFSVVVSLIPGRALYQTMNYAVSSNFSGFVHSGMVTLSVAAAIAIGITVVLVLMQFWNKVCRSYKERKLKKAE